MSENGNDSNDSMSFDDISIDAGLDADVEEEDTNTPTTDGGVAVQNPSVSSPSTTTNTLVDYELHDTNIMHDLVKHSRANQVMNEEPTMMMLLVYATGWLPETSNYAAAFISGGSGQGKSHMKESVVDPLFDNCPDDTLYVTTGGSDQGILNDPQWDECTVGALNEMNKLNEDQIDFFKSMYDVNGFSFRRSVKDSDAHGGYNSDKIERDPKPFVMMLADENALEIDPELLNRLVEIRVDESPELSKQVGALEWGHSSVTMPENPHEYNQSFDAGTEALKEHIASMPSLPVHIPNGEGDEWDAWSVIEPIINFYQEDAKRVAETLSNLCMASALLNYHTRDRRMIGGEEHIVVEAEDVANLLVARRTILSSTHNLNNKKFAIIDAFEEIGGHLEKSGSKRQLEFEQISDYLGERKDLPTIPRKQLQSMLEEMNERYIISIEDHPQDAGNNIYVYGGGSVFGEPNIGAYPELFDDIADPIHGGTVKETVRDIQEQLGTTEGATVMQASDGMFASSPPSENKSNENGGNNDSGSEDTQRGSQASLSGASNDTRIGVDELSETAQTVRDPLRQTLDGLWVKPSELEDIRIEHMCSAASTELHVDDEKTYMQATAEPTTQSKTGTLFDPEHEYWNDKDLSMGEVRAEIEDAVGELKGEGFFEMNEYENSYQVQIK